MTEQTDVEACWEGYLRSLPTGAAPSGYFEASAFGAEGEAELADELADLVERGIKTATSSPLRYYQEGNWRTRSAGWWGRRCGRRAAWGRGIGWRLCWRCWA